MRQRDTILLTGFGPFPGVAENASQRFVPKLAHLAARRFSAHRVVSRILPTEWERAPGRLKTLYERERPKLVLHFGVSSKATCFVIETQAHNLCRSAEDAVGALPSDTHIVRGGPATHATHVPAEEIKRRLAALRVPAELSDDAGGYLCNAIFYHSLLLAEQGEQPATVGFFSYSPGNSACVAQVAGRSQGDAVRLGDGAHRRARDHPDLPRPAAPLTPAR